jgi:taurine dioxygenase
VTAAHNPPAASILRGVTIPPYGGDTQWTNLAALRSALQTAAGLCRACVASTASAPAGSHGIAGISDLVRDNTLISEHPLVTIHPETGEKVLYISPGFLKSIVELSTANRACC